MNSEKTNLNQNKKYLETHNVTKYVEELMAALLKDKPEEPLQYMMKFIQKKAQQSGIYFPLMSNSDIDKRVDLQSSANNRSYDKPWLSGTIKKTDDISNSTQIVVNGDISQNKYNSDTSGRSNTNIDDEFRLVNATVEEVPDKDKIIEENYELLKASKSQTGTKEMLLQMIIEEEKQQIEEKRKLEEKCNNNAILCDTCDCAVELADDPDMLKNEFKVPGSPSGTQPQPTVVIKREIIFTNSHGSEVNNGIKLTMCPDCARFYQNGDENNSIKHSTSSPFANSVIFDDIESASQVNGPRPITDITGRPNRSISSKKTLSVTDIDATHKGWPVLETGSDMSANKRNTPRPKPSSRLFQS